MTHDDDARVADLLARLGDGDSKELFRRLLEAGMQELIDAELTAAIGAAPHERTDSRSNQRNGSRSRLLSTPAGDVELKIPKVRVGSFFPSLLEPRRRVDKALWGVIMTAYTTGTSTQPLVASRLTMEEFYGRALVIHAGGDNYSDFPDPLGGGGARIACGVIPTPDTSNTAAQTSSDSE